MNQVESFHLWAHICISLIGAVLLLALWNNIRKRFRRILEEDDRQQRIDRGLAYLSLALFMWVCSGSWRLAFSYWGSVEGTAYAIGYSLFSTANNLFLLLALSHFRHAPEFLYLNKRNLSRLLLAIASLALISIVLIIIYGNTQTIAGIQIGYVPEVLLSGFVSYLLIISFLAAFNQRGFRIVGLIAVSTVVLMFVSQVPEIVTVLNDNFVNNLVKIIAKTSLISIFLVLATTWVIQLANTPVPSEMAIDFQDWALVKITIPSKRVLARQVDFGSKATQFKNFLKFAIRRKYGTGLEQSILVGADGELKSQTYLSRIVENMNEILQMNEEEKLERKDLFTFIGQGRYRLRVLPENISIDDALANEFLKGPDNEGYSQMGERMSSVTNPHN